jgi:sensor domain CHASE-containing protein
VTVIVGSILLLVAAAIVATTGLPTDVGGTHASFAVFGDQFTGSASTLVPLGIVIGAAVLLGLVVLPADAQRATARGKAEEVGLPLPTRHDVADRSHGAAVPGPNRLHGFTFRERESV